jgi:DNA-binding CsgD family transcriptional regulator
MTVRSGSAKPPAASSAPSHRHRPREGPLRVLVGKERFSENHAWSEMPQHWPAGLAGRAVIEVVGQGELEARLVAGGPPVDVVVPLAEGAQGNPFFLIELLTGLRDERLIDIHAGHATVTQARPPLRVRDSMRRQAGQRPLALASALEDLAVAETRAGRTGQAIAALDRALVIHAGCGARWDLGRVRSRLRQLGVRRRLAAQSRPARGWAAMTDSELAVVRLVADGLTNREVGERLYISPHTVDGHLRHAFEKLGINSRVTLTRIASEHPRTGEADRHDGSGPVPVPLAAGDVPGLPPGKNRVTPARQECSHAPDTPGTGPGETMAS